MIVLLLPLVAAILFSERAGWLYPAEYEAYDSVRVYSFVLTSDSKPTAKCERFKALSAAGDVYLYILRDSARVMPARGDTVIARTRIQRPKAIGDFDYGKYLLRNGIVGTAFVGKKYQIHESRVRSKELLQKRLYQLLTAAGLSGDELATTGAMTLGYKEDLDPALRHHFQASGAAHVLAVSGLHTGIIYALLLGLLTLGGRFRPMHENRFGRWTISLIIIGVMWFYAWLTGMTPSVVRAVLMVTIFEVGRMAYRQAISLNTIAAAAVLILLVRPLDLFSVSFQLSFAATASIVLCMPLFRRDIIMRLQRNFFGKIVYYFLGIIIVSLAAQIGTLPITMHTFGQFSTYFLLTNLIVLPIASFLVPCGLASVALGGSGLGLIVGKITWVLAWAMNHAVGWIESLPVSTIPVTIGLGMVIVYYALVIILIIVNS
ncbi:MAG: ComEC/Rec2 family competence protein [Paludibacteraceae bacterium]|nr:ComEC/Rec2 family competence protein [Paludibacteraceae bacterium]